MKAYTEAQLTAARANIVAAIEASKNSLTSTVYAMTKAEVLDAYFAKYDGQSTAHRAHRAALAEMGRA